MFNEKLNKEMTAIYSEDTYTTDMKGSNNVCQSSKHFLVDACGRWFGRVILLGAIMFTFAFSSNVAFGYTKDSVAVGESAFLNCHGTYTFYTTEAGVERTFFECDHAADGAYDRIGHQRGAVESSPGKGGIVYHSDMEWSGYSTLDCIVYATDSDGMPIGDTIEISANTNVPLDFRTTFYVAKIVFEWSDGYVHSFDSRKYGDFMILAPIFKPDGMVIVYPNPTSGAAFVKLDEEFLSNNNVQAVEYKLFGANQTFITTIPAAATSITDETVIPAEHISTHGVYFIKCTITILRDGEEITEVVDVPFLVRP